MKRAARKTLFTRLEVIPWAGMALIALGGV